MCPAPCAAQATRVSSGAKPGSEKDVFNHQLSRARITIERAFGMLTRKFLILARPMPWAFFKGKTDADGKVNAEDFSKPRVLLRVCMKLHNACIDDRLEEMASVTSDFTGGYETPEARTAGAGRGEARARPRSPRVRQQRSLAGSTEAHGCA